MEADLRPLLIAEDDDRDMELTNTALERQNLANRIVRARDGVEAMDFLRRQGRFSDRDNIHPAVVLLDLKMPRMNGIDVIRHMKSDPELRAIPIVAVTSSRETPDIEQCYEFGVNAYVVKPVDFDEFVNAVGEVGLFWGIVNEPPTRRLKATS